MTKEEREKAIVHGKEQLEVFGGEHAEFIKLAIEALEQEPCEDAISRKEVFEMIEQIQDAGGFIGHNTYLAAFDRINNMPSVTPTRKEGYWIEVNTNMYTCSNCSHCFTIVPEDNRIQQFNYCPNCKTKMQGVKE